MSYLSRWLRAAPLTHIQRLLIRERARRLDFAVLRGNRIWLVTVEPLARVPRESDAGRMIAAERARRGGK